MNSDNSWDGWVSKCSFLKSVMHYCIVYFIIYLLFMENVKNIVKYIYIYVPSTGVLNTVFTSNSQTK